MFGLSPTELIIVGVVAVLLFGSNLPDVARKLGKSYHELRRNLDEVQSQFRKADMDFRRTLDQPTINVSSAKKPKADDDEFEEPTAPRFVPPADDDEPTSPKFTPPA